MRQVIPACRGLCFRCCRHWSYSMSRAGEVEPPPLDVPYAHLSVHEAVLGLEKLKELHTESSDPRPGEGHRSV